MKSSPIAYNLLRDTPHYRRDAFTQGLKACGFVVENYPSGRPNKNDVLVIWNRYNMNEIYARQFEAVGAKVLVVENGYADIGEKVYAISIGQHHHGKRYEHHSDFNVPYVSGDYVLVCAQRGIGSELMRSPDSWEKKIQSLLKTKREIRIRYHPGKHPPKVSLDDDLHHAHACVIWSSSCGIEALRRGVPVIYDAPRWIGEESGIRWSKDLDVENLPHFPQYVGINRAMSNQFSIKQIITGQPMKDILWPSI